jgi:hypothetical protein
MWDVLEAPWGRTAFKEGFAGDVLTSTVRVIVDLTFSVLYFLSGVKGWCVLYFLLFVSVAHFPFYVRTYPWLFPQVRRI